MNASDIAAFARLSAEDRLESFGGMTAPRGITYLGKCYPAVISGIRQSKDFETGATAGGQRLAYDLTIRVLRSIEGFAPAEKGIITLNHTGQRVRIENLNTNVPAEWVMGCVNSEEA